MLRVVLADDERKVIFLLRELIDWDKLGYEIVGVAHDGLRALELVADKQPHLLVTDIRMPGCSGLDLIRQAKERQPGMHFIIISGYREFEYAQSALKYGVEDYLLKPIKKEELTSLLLRLRDKLGEEERQELSRARSEENQQEHLILDLRQAAVQENEPQDSFFSAEEIGERYGLRFPDHGSPEREKNDGAPGSTDKEDKEIKEGKKYKEDKERKEDRADDAVNTGAAGETAGRYYMILVHPDIPDAAGKPDSYRILLRHAAEITRRNIAGIAAASAVAEIPEGIAALISCSRYDAAEVRHCMTRICREIEKERDLFWDIRAFIAIGSRRGSMEEILPSVREVLWLCADRICSPGRESVIRDAEAEEIHLQLHYAMDPGMRKKIQETGEYLAAENFEAAAADSFDVIQRDRDLTGAMVKEWYDEVIRACVYGMELNGKKDPQFTDLMQKWFWSCRTPQEVFSLLKSQLSARMHSLREEKAQQESRPIAEAKRYILEHCDQPLRLEDVSDHVGFNATYFSTFFKKETGQGFADYLAGVRIERAKGLLVRDDLSVMDVCEQVGYKDLKYFSRLFKKVTGISPSDYRKLYR